MAPDVHYVLYILMKERGKTLGLYLALSPDVHYVLYILMKERGTVLMSFLMFFFNLFQESLSDGT